MNQQAFAATISGGRIGVQECAHALAWQQERREVSSAEQGHQSKAERSRMTNARE